MRCTQEAPGKQKELRDQVVGLFFFDEDSERFIPGIEGALDHIWAFCDEDPRFGSLIWKSWDSEYLEKRSSSGVVRSVIFLICGIRKISFGFHKIRDFSHLTSLVIHDTIILVTMCHLNDKSPYYADNT